MRTHRGCRRALKFGGYFCGDVSYAGRDMLCDQCADAGAELEYIAPLSPVWYVPSAGNVHAAIVLEGPRNLNGDQVAKIRLIDSGRSDIVLVDRLEPRELKPTTPLNEFIAVFFGVYPTNPEAA